MSLSIGTRVQELIALYSAPRASAAALLCDRHDPGSLAYRIVDRALQAQDFTYGALRAELGLQRQRQ